MMDSTGLPTGTALRRRFYVLPVLWGGLSVTLTCVYLIALLRLPREQWIGFWVSLGVVFPFAVLFSQRLFSAKAQPLIDCLDRWSTGSATPEDVRGAYGAASNLAYAGFHLGMLDYLVGGVLVVVGVWLRFDDFQPFSGLVMLGGIISIGFVTSLFYYFAVQHEMAPIRERLAQEIPDPEERGSLVRSVPLGSKLRLALVGITATSIGFAALLSVVRASRPIEAFSIRAQHVMLETLASAPAASVDKVLPETRAAAARLGVAQHVILVDREKGVVADGDAKALSPSEIRHLLAAGDAAGDSGGVDSEHVHAWVTLADGRLAVTVADWGVLLSDRSGVIGVSLGLTFVAIVLGLLAARLLGREVDLVARSLRSAAERIAEGDLTVSGLPENEDELGDVARSFAEMVTSLRETIGRVASATNRVESSAGQISGASESVARVTADQMKGLQLATQSMDSVSDQMTGIAEAAGGLNASVEQSSDSILELGALGDELNRTASLLSTKVDEVSSSIEQMIGSVRQVAQSVETLADASEGTSSSMEEMATSLRDVDANAAETAKLSSRVVATAEAGRERVRQTIVGMSAIHDTTETAERLIRSLGSRAKEIGAIVDVIDDVADETNLLALNAAIIAAQAGEQGKAFSVVADQIKDLADRVLASTKEIADLIRAVQGETANAIAAVEQGSRSVQEGVDLSAEAGVALEEITGASKESGLRIAEIVNAVREQARAATHVVGLMEKVRSGVERIREAGREQERGNQLVHDGVFAMRDAALQVHATSAEQARGSARIRDSIGGVRQASERINQSLQDQSQSCRLALGTLEQVCERTRANEDASRSLEIAMRGIFREAETLRADVRRFRVADDGAASEEKNR